MLRINLSNRKCKEEDIGELVSRRYLGGLALGSFLVWKEVGPQEDAFGGQNKVVIATGPFQGTGIPGSGRWIAVAKSPLTGIIGHTCGGGFFGVELKRSGYDAMIVEGRANSPVYLCIDESGVRFEDARGIWGHDAYESEKMIKETTGDEGTRIMSIGQAGEKLVRFAGLITDEGHGVGGRTGIGAVFGSKNLKSIAVRGTKKVEIAKPDELKDEIRKYSKLIAKRGEELRKYGSAGYLTEADELGDLPRKNWSLGIWNGSEKISGEAYAKEYLIKPYACSSCPVACHRYGRVYHRYSKCVNTNRDGFGPEYESLACLGSLTLVDDLSSIVEANDLCNRFGIDTIEVGNIVAFVMESYDHGYLTAKELKDLKPTWGNAEALVRLIEMISFRKGIGDLLAEGYREILKKMDKKARSSAIHVKGLSLPAHDPRAFFYLSLNYATASRGACHLHGWPHGNFFDCLIPEAGISKVPRFSEEKMAQIVAVYQNWAALYDSLVQCIYMSFTGGLTLTDQAVLLKLTTGLSFSPQQLLELGERAFNVQRMFSVAAGANTQTDTLPKRVLTPLATGPTAGKSPEFNRQIIERYYKKRGWDRGGIPTSATLKRLKIV
jgi:aldehyde:ferredoxin oxidoreductase